MKGRRARASSRIARASGKDIPSVMVGERLHEARVRIKNDESRGHLVILPTRGSRRAFLLCPAQYPPAQDLRPATPSSRGHRGLRPPQEAGRYSTDLSLI